MTDRVSIPVGAVLCGGASTRMGVDKATLEIGGVAMARRVADSLAAAGCARVVAIGGDALALGGLGLEHVRDEFPAEGPLGGVLTALSLASPVAVVACDLPNLRPETIVELMATLGDHDACIARSDRAEPLCAVWSVNATSHLRAQFVAGERAMHRAIESLDTVWMTVSATEVRNVNTREDLRSLYS